jgi:aflatoxin B1 aldehyde reductase
MGKSLAGLRRDAVDIYYVHSPDGSATLTETLQAVNELHAEGKFRELGISNFPAWQLMQIIQISKERGWVPPTVFQGAYSAVQRHAELELLPLCRAHGIRCSCLFWCS